MTKKFDFLTSVRFWKLVIVGIVFALFKVEVIPEAWFVLIQTVLVGSVIIKTVDRFSEKLACRK